MTQPRIQVADESVVRVDTDNPFLIHSVGAGETTIVSSFQGQTVSLTVIGDDLDAGRTAFDCPFCPAMDAMDWEDWADLPHAIHDDNKDVVAHFGVCYDGEYVQLTVRVLNDSILVEEGKLPWEQDSIGVRFDARSEPYLRKDEGYSSWDEFGMSA